MKATKKALMGICVMCLGAIFMAGLDTPTGRGTRLVIYSSIAIVCIISIRIIDTIEA